MDTILIVDDKEENIFSLQTMLELDDRRFFTARSGPEALQIAFKEDISLILLDVQMPEMDGFETARQLKANPHSAKVPIVFVTAINKDNKYVVQGLTDGAIDYLFKPLDIYVTRAKVSTLLQFYNQQIELELKNKQLEQLNQDKSRLLGMAAHDLRGPLGNVSMLCDLMLGDVESLNPMQEELVTMMDTSVKFMLDLINSLLDVSTIESGRLDLDCKEVNLTQLIRKAVNIFMFSAKQKNIVVEFNPVLPDLTVCADQIRIQQVIQNLISNALKFSKPGTTVTVALEQHHGEVIVSVKDEGQGIMKEELGRLFQFFQKTSTLSTHGESSTGLGLAISQKIMEAHGGGISVESEYGEGSVFRIRMKG